MSNRRLVLVALAVAAAPLARAAELPDLKPAPPWTFASAGDRGCTLGPIASAVSLQLHVRVSPRHVGPYAVTMPGYGPEKPDVDGFDPYAPYLVSAAPGQSLLIDLHNERDDGAEINLHTHGLVTSPRPYSRPCNSPGDYIFASTEPGHDQAYRIDIPKRVFGIGEGASPRADNDDGLPFPTGLYWIHSHIHGDAKNDVFAGQSAVLDIEDPRANDPVSKALAALPSKQIALRDLQVGVAKGRYPDAPGVAAGPALPASWINGDQYLTTACDPVQAPGPVARGPGYCAVNGVPMPDGTTDSSRDLLWLMTVNGAVAPDIAVKAGQKQLWKIANLSPVLFYVLDLAPASCGDAPCPDKELTFDVVKVDGVVTGEATSAGATTRTLGAPVKQLLLPPAARAEIVVSSPGGGEARFNLRTLGFQTGGVGSTNGDPWPEARLAQVTFEGEASALAPKSAAARPTYSVRPPVRTASYEARPARQEPIPRNCVAMSGPRYRRVITLGNPGGDFVIGSTIVDAAGHQAAADANGLSPLIEPVAFEHGNPPSSIPHVCAKYGTEEIWEIDNPTNELHNFHIHQTKFTLARAADRARFPGLPEGFKDEDAFVDPLGVMGQVDGASSARTLRGIDVWHDTLPIPPAQTAADGTVKVGRIFIRIPFLDARQIGTYVFHCHILEHEDGGMMAEVEVYDPRDPTASRVTGELTPGVRAAKAGICGRPPNNAGDYALPAAPRSLWASLAAALR